MSEYASVKELRVLPRLAKELFPETWAKYVNQRDSHEGDQQTWKEYVDSIEKWAADSTPTVKKSKKGKE